MAISNELSILTQAEQRDLYSAPQFSIEEQRLYFSLNDVEQECRTIRLTKHRCYFVALLGYFKSKPVIIAPSFRDISIDMQFIASQIQRGKGIRYFQCQ